MLNTSGNNILFVFYKNTINIFFSYLYVYIIVVIKQHTRNKEKSFSFWHFTLEKFDTLNRLVLSNYNLNLWCLCSW